ncbi:SAM-dependent methyltransferase [Pseudonocardia sp. CA-107938]|uniref:SAM-dependent methyltransferase n=1 Tax=Pseudonocardia sp. CA-107938 TaxID=3240021 RepID=UPI003D91F231
MTEDESAALGLDGENLSSEIDPTRPSIARVYDFVLGGKQHFAIDREVSKAMFTVLPQARQLAESGRITLLRMVRWLVREAGITRIVDLGSGLPTEGNVHEIAHAIDPDVRVVYVDNDPMVLAHSRALLDHSDNVAVIESDIRDVEATFAHPELRALIDLDEPFAIVAANVLHHLEDADAYRTAAALRARLSPGSYFASCNFLDDDEQRARDMERAMIEGGLGTGRFRTWSELQQFFEGLEMVEPGLTYAHDWRPDEDTPQDSAVHTLHSAGIGRRPS